MTAALTTPTGFLTPSTAVLLLHLQNEVLDARGAIGRNGIAAVVTGTGLFERVGRLQDLADAARAPVIHVIFAANSTGSCTSTAPALRRGAQIGFQPGSWGTKIPPALVRSADRVVAHDTMSAFSGTDLATTLRAVGITRVALAGVSTHLVVAASAFAAADLAFDVVVVADCCAAPDADIHRSALAQLSSVAEIVTDR